MLYQIDHTDDLLLKEFFDRIHIDPEEEKDIFEQLNDKIVAIGIKEDGHITVLLTAKLINNNYYLDDVKFLVKDWDSLRSIVQGAIDFLRDDERGLNIYYDNAPYSEQMNELLLSCGFKGISSLYHYAFKEDTIWPIKHQLSINDRSADVYEYLLKHHSHSLESENNYLGFKLDNQPEIVNLEKANIVVVRDEKSVKGLAKFNLIDTTIVLSLLYGESKDIIVDMINYIRNLTKRDVDIKVLYVRQYIKRILEELGFHQEQTELIYKLF